MAVNKSCGWDCFFDSEAQNALVLNQFHYFKFMDFFQLYVHIQGVLMLIYQAVALGRSLSELLVSFQVMFFEFPLVSLMQG